MTPAILAAEAAGVEFRLHELAELGDRVDGPEALASVGLDPARVFKTLIARLDGRGWIAAVLPLTHELDLRRLAAAAGGRRATMASPRDAERSSGYVLGGISPLGQRRRLPTFVDESALGYRTVLVNGGRRGLEIELAPAALRDLCDARIAAIARRRRAT